MGKTVRVGHTPPVVDDPGKAIRDGVIAQHGEVTEKPLPEGCVEVELPTGSTIIMGPPQRGVMVLISQIIREQPDNAMLFSLIKALMYIRSIDGSKVELPQNMVDVQALCNRLGPDGEDIVIMTHMTYWPPIGPQELRVVKKNL